MALLARVQLWFVRLFMLLWKDIVIRWRTSSIGCTHRLYGRIPIFLLIEILWPLILYAIIVTLRNKYPPTEWGPYQFLPVAMPSAGTLPFLQSLICDLDGDYGWHHDMPVYPNAPINDIYESLDDYGSLNGPLDSFCDAVHSLSASAECLNRTTISQAKCQGDTVPITCYLGDPGGFETFLVSDLGISQSVTDGILGATVDANLLPDFLFPRGKRQVLPGLPTTITPFQLRTLICVGNGSLLDTFVHFKNVSSGEVSQELCALNSSQFSDLTDELQRQTSISSDCSALDGLTALNSLQSARELADKFSNSDLFSGGFFTGNAGGNGGFDLDQTTRFFCGDKYAYTTALKLLLLTVLFGNDYQQSDFEANGGTVSLDSPPDRIAIKILYSPMTTHTHSVISKASKVLDTIKYFKDFAGQIVNCSDEFLINFPPYSSQANSSRLLVSVLLGDYDNTTTIPGGQPYNLTTLPTETIDALNQFRENSNLDRESLEQIQQLLDPQDPNNIWETVTKIRDIAKSIHDTLNVFDWNVFYPTESEEALESLADDYVRQAELNFTSVFGGVVFEGLGDDTPLTNATIKIRMNVTNVLDPTKIIENVWYPGPEWDQRKKNYLWKAFMFIQDMVERAVVEEIAGHPIPSPGAYLQQMPHTCYLADVITVAMEFVLPLAMLFSWLFPVAMTVRAIVREKETRVKEYIKMLGVSDSQIRLSRAILSGGILMISVCFVTVALKAGNILPKTDWVILFLYLSLYALVMLAYCFLVSTAFNNANLAACVASLGYFMVVFGHMIIVTKQQHMSPFTIGLASLCAPLGFAIGAQYMVQWELQQIGLQWDNINLLVGTDSQLSFQGIVITLVFDTVLYFVLTWYIEGVAPGRYGVAKPLYFPFLPSYWLGQTGHDCCSRGGGHTPLEDADDTVVCEEDPGLPLGVSIESLTKVYKSWFPKRTKVTAVKDLSLNFFEGQISALLGHNGAGKTTTLSILAGLFEPTSGTARIYGNDIRYHMDIIRQGLGICPQHNVLFDKLTVEEHLLFFGQLKGLSWQESRKQIKPWLSKVGLSCHANKLAQHLSGGMKRKLSILLAFVGGSKTIILDEPTAGVDPFARRGIWDFLLRQREGRTILLSTHHMDEAEILGDRIALLSSGSLLCSGSFEFLKARFARGHKLTLVTSSNVSVDRITDFINRFVVGSSLVETRGPELHYQLPIARARGTVLTQLFRSLEDSKEELGVASYGLSAPALEEIFVDLTEKNATDDPEQPTHSINSKTTPTEATPTEVTPTETTPTEVTPTEDTPTETAPTEATPTETTPTEATPTEATPTEATPTDITDTASLGGNSINSETTPTDTASLGGSIESEQELLSQDNQSKGLERLSGVKLWVWQFLALTLKRFHYTKRRLPALLVQNILPLMIILLTLIIARALQDVGDPPPIELSPPLFFQVNRDNYMFVGGKRTPATEPFINSLFQPCGVGAHVTSHDPNLCFNGNGVYDPNSRYECSDYPSNQTGQCTCHSRDDRRVPDFDDEECSYYPTTEFIFEKSTPFCYNGTGTGSRVQDITSDDFADITTYLLRTKQLNSSANNLYVQARYGGLSFGHERSDFNDSVGLDSLPFLAVKPVAKAWYSLKGSHAMPAYLNVLNNALLRGSLDPGKPQHMYGIKTISHPFKTSDLTKQVYAINENSSFLVNPLSMMFSLGFVVAGFVLILIEERSKNVKHLQTVCGMNKIVYWLANISWDFLWYIGFMVLTLALYLMFQDQFYTTTDTFPLFVVILLLYGIAVIPWVYALSFLFSSPATAYVSLFCLNFFGGFCFLIADAITLYANNVNGNPNGKDQGDTLNYPRAAVPIPAYHMGRCMMFLSSDYPLLRLKSLFDSDIEGNPWVKLGPYLGAMVGHAALFTIIVVVIESWPFLRGLFCRVRSSISSLPRPVEADHEVAGERVRVQEETITGSSEDILSINGLSKVYRSERRWRDKRVAVNQLCLGVKRGQCFGLLGVNGAGKTTTFKMLTGDIRPSAGEAMIGGRQLSESHDHIGYCPQVDALIDQLTGRQHLVLFCALRGLSGAQLEATVNWALLKLGLMEYADRTAGAYSGGNRRKLSTAIALLSQPSLVLLDEPTSGVDPRARHFLWGVVNDLVSEGQSVVLTTHSMAECEALCSRVAIMVNGELHCLGSPQQLKNTYGTGYRLKLRVNGQLEPVKEFLRQNFEGATVKEEHYTTLVYQLPADLDLATVFEKMEQARQTLDIQDYSVSQTTLDDVFIHFASAQSEEVGIISRTGEIHTAGPDGTMPDIVPLGPIENIEQMASISTQL